MSDVRLPKPPGRVRGRPFAKGNRPAGRRAGSRNKKTLAAAVLLAGEAEALTRKAVELALAGDPTAMRLCIERILPPCRERAVKFALPPIESAADIAAAMKAVTSGARRGWDHSGRGGDDRGGGRHLRPGDRDQRLRTAPAGLRDRICRATAKASAKCAAPGRVGNSIYRREFCARSALDFVDGEFR